MKMNIRERHIHVKDVNNAVSVDLNPARVHHMIVTPDVNAMRMSTKLSRARS
jgi:hypothetical protein